MMDIIYTAAVTNVSPTYYYGQAKKSSIKQSNTSLKYDNKDISILIKRVESVSGATRAANG